MNSKTKILFGILAVITATLVISLVMQYGFAWTNPASAPPSGSGTLKVVDGNVGIGTTNPNYKLDVNGIISGTSVLNPTYAP